MDLEKRLRSRGYRMTAQREAVYGVLVENEGKPLSPEDIHRMAGAKHPGLGLSTVFGIIERHKGHVSVESRPGEGTAFRLELPVSEKEK